MAYDSKANQITYTWAAVNFGTSSVKYIQGPKGMQGKIIECQVVPTTAFVGTTTPGAVQLGPAGTLTQSLNLPLGIAGTGSPISVPVLATDQPASLDVFPGTPAGLPPWTYIAADTVQTVSFIAPTGGSPAGVADVYLTIEWDK